MTETIREIQKCFTETRKHYNDLVKLAEDNPNRREHFVEEIDIVYGTLTGLAKAMLIIEDGDWNKSTQVENMIALLDYKHFAK